MKAVMIDIEGSATSPFAGVLSIGAVPFDLRGDGSCGPAFHAYIRNWEEREVDPETMEWWSQQSPEARQIFEHCKTAKTLKEVLVEFAAWIQAQGAELYWANAPTYDMMILRNAYEECGLEFPFPFWAERDVRTLYNFMGIDRRKYKNDLAHDAVADCDHQILLVQASFKELDELKRK